MITGMDVVSEARTWLLTPFQHQGRVKGRAVDCAGLVVGVAQVLGLAVSDRAGYSRTPHADILRQHLDAQMVQVAAAEPGDIYLMRFERDPQHLGIASDIGIIHAFSAVGMVVEHAIDAKWARRVVAVYRFMELVHE